MILLYSCRYHFLKNANIDLFSLHEAISSYTIGIDKEGERIITESFGRDYYISFDEPGNYSVYVSAYNSAGWADSNVLKSMPKMVASSDSSAP